MPPGKGTEPIGEVMKMTRCKKCGSKIFFVDETVTRLEVGGEIVKHLGNGDLHNKNCVRCRFPELYDEYKDFAAR